MLLQEILKGKKLYYTDHKKKNATDFNSGTRFGHRVIKRMVP